MTCPTDCAGCGGARGKARARRVFLAFLRSQDPPPSGAKEQCSPRERQNGALICIRASVTSAVVQVSSGIGPQAAEEQSPSRNHQRQERKRLRGDRQVAGVAGGRLRGENRDRGEGVLFRCSNKIEPTAGCYESYGSCDSGNSPNLLGGRRSCQPRSSNQYPTD